MLVLPAALWYAAAAARYMSYARTPQGIFFRSGVWTKKISATLMEKVQVVSLGQSPFDRRWRMAALDVDTAGAGPASHRIRIPYLEEDVARGLLAGLYERTQASEFRW